MAKKKSAEVNVSASIREVLTENPALTGKETLAAVLAKHPGATINEKSFQVAYSVIRGKMGLGGKRQAKVRRKKPAAREAAARPVTQSAAAAAAEKINIAQLQLAQEFISKVGGTKAALAAIDQLNKLQVK